MGAASIHDLNAPILLHGEDDRARGGAGNDDAVVGVQGNGAADTRQLLFADALHQLARSRHFIDVADRPDGVTDDRYTVGEEQRALIECGCPTAIAAGRGEGGAETGVELLLPRVAA